MKPVVTVVLLFLLAASAGIAAEPSGGTGSESDPLRMKELEVHGSAPLLMEELEVRGLREKPGVLYLPAHRAVAPPSPVRYDLFLEDMERPVLQRGILPGTPRAESLLAPGKAP